jgi:Putative zincin peptidase
MSDESGLGAESAGAAAAPQPLGRFVARLVAPSRRRAVNAALAEGRARRIAVVELLGLDRLNDLAGTSLWLLLAGLAGFGALEMVAWIARSASPWPPDLGSGWLAVALVGGNLALYGVVLPLHEAVHAAVFLALGGRPRFGVKLPFALYCTAPGQLFTRAGYTAVALGPLVVLSLAGAAAIWLAPSVGAYLLFALAGNVSGAVGDLEAARGVRSLPSGALIADKATGYEAYAVETRSI